DVETVLAARLEPLAHTSCGKLRLGLDQCRRQRHRSSPPACTPSPSVSLNLARSLLVERPLLIEPLRKALAADVITLLWQLISGVETSERLPLFAPLALSGHVQLVAHGLHLSIILRRIPIAAPISTLSARTSTPTTSTMSSTSVMARPR